MEKGVEISCEKLNKGKLYLVYFMWRKKLFSMKDRNKTEKQASYKPHKSTVDFKKILFCYEFQRYWGETYRWILREEKGEDMI